MKRFTTSVLVATLAVVAACSGNATHARESEVVENSGLSGVRLIGLREALVAIQQAAADAGWTKGSFDDQGRLVLLVPPSYTPDDFGNLLQAIDPHTAQLRGLQMLGPNGRPVDDNGVEQAND